MRKIIEDYDKTKRFEMNRIIRFLLDSNDNVDLNKIWKYHEGELFNHEELKEFYQLIGYTVNGYNEIFNKDLNGLHYH